MGKKKQLGFCFRGLSLNVKTVLFLAKSQMKKAAFTKDLGKGSHSVSFFYCFGLFQNMCFTTKSSRLKRNLLAVEQTVSPSHTCHKVGPFHATFAARACSVQPLFTILQRNPLASVVCLAPLGSVDLKLALLLVFLRSLC